MALALARRFRRLGIAAAAAAVLAAVLVTATAVPGDLYLYPPRPGRPTVTAYVVDNGYHTEIALPSAFVHARGGASDQALSQLSPSPWVMIGWGDAAFYTGRGWSPRRIGEALDAALPPSNASRLRLTPLARDPSEAFGGAALRLTLSEAGAERMLRRLEHAFRRLQDGTPVRAPSAPHHGAALFFEGAEDFGFPKLCNNWTGDVVAYAGLPVTPALHLTPQGLMWDLRRASPQVRDQTIQPKPSMFP
jgi:hypothetical protein